jgi:Family of unknown function (DUF6962)
MDFVQIPVEQTTAVTDIIFAVVAISIFFLLRGDKNKKRNLMWKGYFFCYFIGGVLGAIGHGIKIDVGVLDVIWNGMYLFLGLGIGFFTIAVLNDLFNKNISKLFAGLCLLPSILFYLITVFISGSFTVFVVYTLAITIFGLVVYTIIFVRTKDKAILILLGGIFLTVLTGAAHALVTGEIHFIWVFDKNSVMHIIQAIGLALTYLGVAKTQNLFDFEKNK